MADPLIINDAVLDHLVDMVIKKGETDSMMLPMKDVSIVLDDKKHKLFQKDVVICNHLNTLFIGRSILVIRNALVNAKTYKSFDRFDSSEIVNFLDKVIAETRQAHLFEEMSSLKKSVNEMSKNIDIILDYFSQDPSEKKNVFGTIYSTKST
jgi:predicted RNA methylase